MNTAIILLAGMGSRMKINKNKVLLEINNKPVYMYSIEAFHKLCDEIVCVVKEDELDFFKNNLPGYCKITTGGDTRAHSVLNGLRVARGDYALIHDGARPFISEAIIAHIINDLPKNEGALCYLPIKDTIKENNEGRLHTLNRSSLIAAVTPQCGPRDLLLDSYERGIKENKSLTDDMSYLEEYHSEVKINLVMANEEVFKITTPLDYVIAKVIGEKL